MSVLTASPMPRSSHALVAVALAVLVLCSTSLSVAAVPYALDSPSEVDVPDQVIWIGYEFYEFDGIARVDHGAELEIQATAPGSDPYGIDLYNSDRKPVAFSDGSLRGNDSASFDTEHLTPGSYIAALVLDREIRAVLPVVVEGYDVSVEGPPDTVETGEDLTVSASLSKDPDSPELTRVELAIVDRESEDIVVQRTMATDGSAYSATVQLDDPGEYEAYVNVRGQKDVRGRAVLLGFSDPQRFSVVGSPSFSGTDDGTTEPDTAGTASPEPTAQPASTDAPDGVITRNATPGASPSGQQRPVDALSMLFALLLVVGLVYWFRR